MKTVTCAYYGEFGHVHGGPSYDRQPCACGKRAGLREPTVNGLTRGGLEAQLASAIKRKCWWAEDAILADLRALDRKSGNK